MKYGDTVWCTYEDDVFRACVPAEHRKQILHQASVMGFNYAMYVVSTSGNEFWMDTGKIVQIVVAFIENEKKEAHVRSLQSIIGHLFGFMFSMNN